MVKQFEYTQKNINNIVNGISAQRLSTYMHVSSSLEQALELYVWNTKVSSALYAPLQSLEIALRNALCTCLCDYFGNAWPYIDEFTCTKRLVISDNITAACKSLKRKGHIPTGENIVSELSFGFWITLLGSHYHNSLWTPVLHKAFPQARSKKRSSIHATLNHLRQLRNRIVHHEPVLNRHLEADYNTIIMAIGWICQDTAEWSDIYNDVLDILTSRPV